MVRKTIVWGLVAVILTACRQGMFETLVRTTADPFGQTPRVESFVKSGMVTVSWNQDEGADTYILERAKDAISPVYETVYQGIFLAYEDHDTEDNGRYLYRLSKRRGDRIFGPWGPVLGASSLVTRDAYEVNDSTGSAVRLETIDIIANMYFYRAYNGLVLCDDDWFYIDIPALRQASVVLIDSEIAMGGVPSHFNYYEFGVDKGNIINENAFWIKNAGLETKRFYIKIYPNEGMFLTAPAGGQLIRYTLKVKTIEPYM
jgi:hypothetical protein